MKTETIKPIHHISKLTFNVLGCSSVFAIALEVTQQNLLYNNSKRIE